MNNPLEFFRIEHFANELASELKTFQIQMLIQFGYEAKKQAIDIKQEHLFDEYGVEPKQIEFDIKAITYNLKQLRKALFVKKELPFQEFTNGATIGLN